MKKIIIGGGQCSGKTTIINELKKDFFCINEASAYLIENGFIPQKHSFEEFQNELIKKQKEIETSSNNEIVFLDRCLIDTILYLEEEGKQIPKTLLNDIQKANYGYVFFLDMLPEKYWVMPAHKKPRITSYEKGAKRTEKLFEIYQRFDIPMKKIPVLPLEERIRIIKDTINELK